MDRAERRHRRARYAAKIKRMIVMHEVLGPRRLVPHSDPRWLGRMIATHMRPCSCTMCQREDYRRSVQKQSDQREATAELLDV